MVIARRPLPAVTGGNVDLSAVTSRLDSLENAPGVNAILEPVEQAVADLRVEVELNARAKWDPGNKYWKVTCEIGGHQFDFDAASFLALGVHPHVAADGLWYMMHEDKRIPFVQDLVRYMRFNQIVVLRDGSEWRLLRDPVTTADRQLFPSLDQTANLWTRAA